MKRVVPPRQSRVKSTTVNLTPLELAVDVPLYSQLTNYMRNAIRSGQLPAGRRIPSLREIARQLEVNPSSLQNATEQLVKEGLLYKVHGKGMYVRDYALRSKIIGILVIQETRLEASDIFIHTLVNELCRKLNEREMECLVWHDNRPPEQRGTMPVYIEEAIQANRLHALIAPNVPEESLYWVNKLPIHFISLAETARTMEAKAYAELTNHFLQQRPDNPFFVLIGDPKKTFTQHSLINHLQQRGYLVNPEQVAFIDASDPTIYAFSETSFQICRKRFKTGNYPDTLVVWPDLAVHGAVGAILENHISIPDQMTVIFHRNREIELFCPFPAIWMEMSTKEISDSLLLRLQL